MTKFNINAKRSDEQLLRTKIASILFCIHFVDYFISNIKYFYAQTSGSCMKFAKKPAMSSSYSRSNNNNFIYLRLFFNNSKMCLESQECVWWNV